MKIFESHQSRNPRLAIFYVLIAAMMTVLLSGMAYRQIVQNHHYSERETQQNLRRVLFPGTRGNIYDREGNLLVANRPRFSAVVYLAELRPEFRREYIVLVRENRERGIRMSTGEAAIQARARVVQRYLDELNQVTGRDLEVNPRRLHNHFIASLLLPFPLVNDLTPDEFALIVEQIPIESKIQIHNSSARYYPSGSRAAHTLGYVSATDEMSGEDLPGHSLRTFNVRGSTGKAGVERSFDSVLHGRIGGEIWVVDPSGFRYGQPLERHPPTQGQDLTITLDRDLQAVAEDELGDRSGTAIAIDIETGEVLALASKPDYDLNDLSPFMPTSVYNDIQERGAWLNRAVQGLYPPGSTFKLITAMAALREGRITPENTSYCAGSFRVGGRNFPCHSRIGHGEVNLVDALRTSCNVYFYEFGVEAGIEAIASEARRFGLHERTGIELPFETGRMIVPDREWKRRVHNQGWFGGDTANVSIGQGYLLITPLQMAAFTASLARGETRTPITLQYPPPTGERGPLPEEVGLGARAFQAIIDGMEEAVEGGTARFAQIPGVRVAGKTGTAQVRTREGTLHLAWFVGFAPVENPRIAVTVMLEGTDIHDNYAGGTTAAPVAKRLFETYLEKYGSRRDELALGTQE